MSYQVLARKWRPGAFEEMVGQSHVLHALTNALGQQRLHHAYLFTGTRGVGKTSIARLFAKGLNCEQGVTAKPCGVCASCVEIAQGRFVDLIEVDAASRTKVDDTRELLDNVQYRPTRGRFKVYLIDEVHMLSRSSFNALLKTLEEPPEHVKFLLATTDPQKLPVTVLSRCLQFNLKSLSQEEIGEQLTHVLSQEGISADVQAISLLAKAANGSMRDGLSLTDQAIAFGAGSISLEQVQAMLGSIDERHVLSLLEALITTNIEQVLAKVAEVLSFGADANEVLRSLLELLHQITLTQFAPAAAQLSMHEAQIKALASQLNPEQVQLYYQILLSGRKELSYAPDPKSGLEMALMRAIAFAPIEGKRNWSTAPIVSQFEEESPQSRSPIQAKSAADTNSAVEKPSSLTETNSTPDTRAESRQEAKAPKTDLKPEIKSEPADSNDTSFEAETDKQLAAEQALILSQAQSQGFTEQPQQQTAQQENVSEESLGTQSISRAANTTSVNSELQNAQIETKGFENKELEVKTAAIDDSGKAALDEHVPLSLYQEGPMHDEISSSLDVAEESRHETNQAQAASETQETRVTSTETSSQGIKDTTTADNSQLALGDDLLDAVLAARESLLDDVQQAEPKDGQSKKSELGSTAVRRALPHEAPDSQKTAEPDSLQAVSEKGAIESQANAQLESYNPPLPVSEPEQQVVAAAASDSERPPWEAKPSESEEVQGQADVSVGEQPKQLNTATSNGSASATHDSAQAAMQSRVSASSEQTRSNTSQEPKTTLSTYVVQGNDVDLHWYKLMAKLEIGGRVRQLAVNSVCVSLDMPISLLLKPDQKHLAAQGAIDALCNALKDALEQDCAIDIQIGVDPQRETPLEIRKRFHRELLGQTQESLLADEAIQWLQQNMAAELDVDSLSYPPELLASRSGQIKTLAFNPASQVEEGA